MSHQSNLVIIEDISGRCDVYMKVLENYGTDRAKVVGAGISLMDIKGWFPECSEALLEYILDKYAQSSCSYESFNSFVEYLLLMDKNVVYDDDSDCYYLKSELKEGNHE